MAKRQQPRLGRGLSSLVGSGGGSGAAVADLESKPEASGAAPARADAAPVANVGAADDGLREGGVGVDEVVASPFQPRTAFDEAGLEELAGSIKRHGMLQPIVVRERAGGGGYELIAGERRWRAAKLAGLARVPAVVKAFTDEEAAEAALVENVQRRDLNPVDRARGLKSLGERFGMSHAAIAERVGLERSSVTNLIRITELEEEILTLLAHGELTLGHGKALLSCEPGRGRVTLAAKAVRESWSVRELERRAGGGGNGGGSAAGSGGKTDARPAGVVDLERRLGEHLGTRVTIKTSGAKGSKGAIEVAFYDLDHFDGLMRRLGLPGDG